MEYQILIQNMAITYRLNQSKKIGNEENWKRNNFKDIPLFVKTFHLWKNDKYQVNRLKLLLLFQKGLHLCLYQNEGACPPSLLLLYILKALKIDFSNKMCRCHYITFFKSHNKNSVQRIDNSKSQPKPIIISLWNRF